MFLPFAARIAPLTDLSLCRNSEIRIVSEIRLEVVCYLQ